MTETLRELPAGFIERLGAIVPEDQLEQILDSFRVEKTFTVRVNTIKADIEQVARWLSDRGIGFEPLKNVDQALIIQNAKECQPGLDEIFRSGWVYKQNLSSQLAARLLDPKPDETVLDMCAAPGSKTSQMAAIMKNQGNITAIESVRSRYFKLKSVLSLLGVENVKTVCKDARRFRAKDQGFDKILLDTPCSSEGRFSTDEPKTWTYWSARKIKEMAHKQKGLLQSAGRLLKPGGIIVYSTCTFAPEENEGVVSWFLDKNQGRFRLCPLEVPGIRTLPVVEEWSGRTFADDIVRCVRIFPDQLMDMFFIAKLQKVHPSSPEIPSYV